jgi:hypothetical protein
MSASSGTTSSPWKPMEQETLEQSIPETFVMFIERGKTEKYGWLGAFDELSDYLGRLS